MSKPKPAPHRLSETCTVADLVLGECIELERAVIGYSADNGDRLLTSRARVYVVVRGCNRLRGLRHDGTWTEWVDLPGSEPCRVLSPAEAREKWGVEWL